MAEVPVFVLLLLAFPAVRVLAVDPPGLGICYGDYFANTQWPGTSVSAGMKFIGQTANQGGSGNVAYIRTYKELVVCNDGWTGCAKQTDTLEAITDSGNFLPNTRVMATITDKSVIALATNKANNVMNQYITKLAEIINDYRIDYLAISNEPDLHVGQPDHVQSPQQIVDAAASLKTKLTGLNTPVKLTVPFSYGVMAYSDTPSGGLFNTTWAASPPASNGIIQTLINSKSIDVFSINIYAHTCCGGCSLFYCAAGSSYATETGNNGYKSMFEAKLDAVDAALKTALNLPKDGPGYPIMVTETGWPTKYLTNANWQNACIYNNYIARWMAQKPYPKTQGGVTPVQVFFFEAFDEDQAKPPKSPEMDTNWGVYTANGGYGANAYNLMSGGNSAAFMDFATGTGCGPSSGINPVATVASGGLNDLLHTTRFSPETPPPDTVAELNTILTSQRAGTTTLKLESVSPTAMAAAPASVPEAIAADGNVAVEASSLDSAEADGMAALPQNGVYNPPGAKDVKAVFTLAPLSAFVTVTVSNKQGSSAAGAVGQMLAPAHTMPECSYKRSTHTVECSFTNIPFGCSKVISIKLKPQAGFHEHRMTATSHHAGFQAGPPLAGYIAHTACYPTGGKCSGTSDTISCCSGTCRRKLGRTVKYACA